MEINRVIKSGYCMVCGKHCGEMLINGKCRDCLKKLKSIVLTGSDKGGKDGS